MRKMEIEAYASGIDVRDWADSKNNIQKENKTMNTKQEALLRKLVAEQVRKIMGKLKEGEKNIKEEDEDTVEEAIGQYPKARKLSDLPKGAKPYPSSKLPPREEEEYSDFDLAPPGSDAAREMEEYERDEEEDRRYGQKTENDVVSPLSRQRLREEEEEVEEGYKGSQFENPPESPDSLIQRRQELGKRYAAGDDSVAGEIDRLTKAIKDHPQFTGILKPRWTMRLSPDEQREKRRQNPKLSPSKEEWENTKITTPEQEQTLYETRFTARDTRIFDRLMHKWAK